MFNNIVQECPDLFLKESHATKPKVKEPAHDKNYTKPPPWRFYIISGTHDKASIDKALTLLKRDSPLKITNLYLSRKLQHKKGFLGAIIS